MNALRREIAKRHLLNHLAQGASLRIGAQSASLLEPYGLPPRLLHLSSTVGVLIGLDQLEGFAPHHPFGAHPGLTWRAVARGNHPFSASEVLRRHGRALADASHDELSGYAETFGVKRRPFGKRHNFKALPLIKEARSIEAPRRAGLEQIATAAIEQEFGLSRMRMSATLLEVFAAGQGFSDAPKPAGLRAKMEMSGTVGWSRVQFFDDGSSPIVEARGLTMALLLHELTKGTVELIACHGLAGIDDQMYREVLGATDGIMLERPALQAGLALYGLWQACLPPDVSVADGLCRLAIASPDIVEATLMAAIEDPPSARQIMSNLAAATI